MLIKYVNWGEFQKTIYALRQALTLCAKLLRLKKLLKSWAQSVKWLYAQLLAFMKSALECFLYIKRIKFAKQYFVLIMGTLINYVRGRHSFVTRC